MLEPWRSGRRFPRGARWESLVGYSRAVRVGQWVSVAGTTAAAEGGGAVGGDDIGEQAREALRRIQLALEQVGARLEDVVRTRMFVTDIGRWEEVGRAHGEVFADIRPATSMVEVKKLIDRQHRLRFAHCRTPGPLCTTAYISLDDHHRAAPK